MIFDSMGGIERSLMGAIRPLKDGVMVVDEELIRDECIDDLVQTAVFSEDNETLEEARKLIGQIARDLGAYPASIQGLYEAMGRGDCSGFTVPAINIRGITYDTARCVFRSAKKCGAGAFIFEIAKSEIGYTAQRPAEYRACLLAAAVKEGFKGPVFIQGDHFQVKAANYHKDRDAEIQGLRDLIKEAVSAEFYNIDIDSSTIVDLEKADVMDQQRPNFTVAAELTSYIREIEPEGVTVSVGGEIGEVGGKNSTEEELRAYMEGFNSTLGEGKKGISKISIQTGTSHGGVVLPDGSIAKVKVDFDTIERLGAVAREYGLCGVVQHGASTLPDDAFHMFPERGAAEVHLATGFQNITYDSDAFPAELKKEVYAWLHDNLAGEKKEGMTDEQFVYKTRKKGFGPFKKQMWQMDSAAKKAITTELEAKFDLLFEKLRGAGSAEHVSKWVG